MKRSRMKRSVHQPDMHKEWDFIRGAQAGITHDADEVQKIDFRTLKKVR